jgi:hypothetical protein
VKLLLPFLLLVVFGAIWETQRGRQERALPLLIACVVIAFGFFRIVRFL